MRSVIDKQSRVNQTVDVLRSNNDDTISMLFECYLISNRSYYEFVEMIKQITSQMSPSKCYWVKGFSFSSKFVNCQS